MKTIYILLLLIFGISFRLMAQYEYYDAMKIKEYTETGYRNLSVQDKVDLAKRLTKSQSINIDNINADTISKVVIKGNDFLNGLFKLPLNNNDSNINRTGGQASRSFLGSFPTSPSSVISSIGGIDVTNIANGVAMLMIDRAKQELTISFFNRFQDYSKKHPEFQVLFPKTTDNLIHLLAYKYPEMLPALRSSFFEDLDKLPIHLDDVLELPRYKELLANFPEIRVAVRTVRLIQEIETGESNAAEVLTQFASFKEWTEPNTSDAFFNFGNTVKLADIISQSLRYKSDFGTQTNIDSTIHINNDTIITIINKRISSSDTGKRKVDSMVRFTITSYQLASNIISSDTNTMINISQNTSQSNNEKRIWITAKQAKMLIEDDTLFKIYLGLILERVKKENIEWRTEKDTISFANIMNENAGRIFLFQSKISEFIVLANAIDKVTDSLEAKIKSHVAFTEDDYFDYIDGSMNVIEYAFSFAALFDSTLDVSAYTNIARNANDLYRHVYKKEYTQALSDAIEIIGDAAKLIDKRQYTGLMRTVPVSDTVAMQKAMKTNSFSMTEKQHFDSTYAGRAVDSAVINKIYYIVNAQDKLQALIDVLSSLNKYGLFMANMIDAKTPEEVQYVLDNAILPVGSSSIKKHACFNVSIQSYLGAYYRFAGKDHPIDNAWDDRFGVTAPIGISVSHGFNKGGSLSVFASLFDIGAIVDYQLQKDTVITSATQTGTAIQKDYSIKLQQIISPGFYLVYGAPWNIPLALGAGAQYGPGLGKIDLGTNDLLERNPSWRFNVFLAVDLPFFNLCNITKGYNFRKN
ncbi:hypothetical protein F0919_03665 [Taibaiella lutea]|uniref:Uncharacterized protein n=1 Tax=Taibaiella lutea TaxID=2608001 RepID=A0A5M6CUB4_9BACT|nr:hypothetical protein [Taibaiella lutea]KAA5536779.1 hypothetical protein F0919_03665 [Taibaiella lutea]